MKYKINLTVDVIAENKTDALDEVLSKIDQRVSSVWIDEDEWFFCYTYLLYSMDSFTTFNTTNWFGGMGMGNYEKGVLSIVLGVNIFCLATCIQCI